MVAFEFCVLRFEIPVEEAPLLPHAIDEAGRASLTNLDLNVAVYGLLGARSFRKPLFIFVIALDFKVSNIRLLYC